MPCNSVAPFAPLCQPFLTRGFIRGWFTKPVVGNIRSRQLLADCVAKVESFRAAKFGENKKRETIADLCILNRVAELAG